MTSPVRCAIAAVVVLSVMGCKQASSPQVDHPAEEPINAVSASPTNSFQPFVVYQDKGTPKNHFVASGFMPNGKCLNMDDGWKQDCYDGSSCIKIVYDIACSREDQKWAGIYWLNPANNWGKQKGGFNLEGAQRLTFWARGEKGGERIEEFKIGGIAGDYPDSDMAMIGPVLLTKEWREYSIDARQGPVATSADFLVDVRDSTNRMFYIDNIQYE